MDQNPALKEVLAKAKARAAALAAKSSGTPIPAAKTSATPVPKGEAPTHRAKSKQPPSKQSPPAKAAPPQPHAVKALKGEAPPCLANEAGQPHAPAVTGTPRKKPQANSGAAVPLTQPTPATPKSSHNCMQGLMKLVKCIRLLNNSRQ